MCSLCSEEQSTRERSGVEGCRGSYLKAKATRFLDFRLRTATA
jgi:hypothetical protein